MDIPLKRRLFYVSDIHLELRKDKLVNDITIIPRASDKPVRNFLALCGDIGCPFHPNYEKLMERHSPLYERIFIITGNHEYYTSKKQRTMAEVEAKLRELVAAFPNVTFLHTNEPYLVDDTLFVGCPLWTPVGGEAETYMNDYRKIYVYDASEKPRHISTAIEGDGMFSYQTNSMGQVRKKWIKAGRRLLRGYDVIQMYGIMSTYLEEMVAMDFTNLDSALDKEKIQKIIILTHHAPSYKMIQQKYPTDSTFNAYASDMEYLFKPPVVCWISGHTHECNTIDINGIPCLSNCFGYPGQKTGVQLDRFIEF